MNELIEHADMLEKLHGNGTPGLSMSLWRDVGDKSHAHELIGIPTKWNELLMCESIEIAGITVKKGSHEQHRAHADMELLSDLRNSVPALIRLLRLVGELQQTKADMGNPQEPETKAASEFWRVIHQLLAFTLTTPENPQ